MVQTQPANTCPAVGQHTDKSNGDCSGHSRARPASQSEAGSSWRLSQGAGCT